MTNGGQPQVKPTSGLAITSLVLGILSLVCLGPFAAIPAVICGHIARSQIRRSAGALGGEGMALAGLVMGYVGIVLTILLVIGGITVGAAAVPALKQAREQAETAVCINNLRQIQIAKQLWRMQFDKAETDTPTWDDLASQMEAMRGGLRCPQGGTYSINAVNQLPTCSIPGHELNAEE